LSKKGRGKGKRKLYDDNNVVNNNVDNNDEDEPIKKKRKSKKRLPPPQHDNLPPGLLEHEDSFSQVVFFNTGVPRYMFRTFTVVNNKQITSVGDP
jgi:hypothetical protein